MSDRAPGWVKVYRSMADAHDRIWNHPSPFDVRSARLDLLLQARFVAGPYATDYGVDQLQRGEFVGSLRYFARRWRWSKDRVARLFKQCVADGFLSRQYAGRHGDVYLIVNYDSYQSDDRDGATPCETGVRQVCDTSATKDKKVRRKAIAADAAAGARETWITRYCTAWRTQYGTDMSVDPALRPLGKIRQELGDDEALARWASYLAETSVTHASAARFAQTHTAYRRPVIAGVARAVPGAVDARDAALLRQRGY